MMSKTTKAFIYNLICFATLFLLFRFLIIEFTGLKGFWIPITAFVASTLTAPKFQAVKTRDGERLFMKWILIKEVKELK